VKVGWIKNKKHQEISITNNDMSFKDELKKKKVRLGIAYIGIGTLVFFISWFVNTVLFPDIQKGCTGLSEFSPCIVMFAYILISYLVGLALVVKGMISIGRRNQEEKIKSKNDSSSEDEN